jgi:PAS domain-containing protein
VPLAVFILSTVAFVRTYFGAGRLWLAWTVAGLRLLALALNFLLTVNINFRALPAIEHVVVWGRVVVSGPAGVPNPWVISNLLLAVFVVDAAMTVWRRGGPDAPRRAALVGGSLVICLVTAGALAALITTGLVHMPTIVIPGAFIVVMAMGYELGWNVVVAAQTAARLRTSEARFRAVVESVPSAILLVDSKGTITLTNAHAAAVFGYERRELVGSPVDLLIPRRTVRAPCGSGPGCTRANRLTTKRCSRRSVRPPVIHRSTHRGPKSSGRERIALHPSASQCREFPRSALRHRLPPLPAIARGSGSAQPVQSRRPSRT